MRELSWKMKLPSVSSHRLVMESGASAITTGNAPKLALKGAPEIVTLLAAG